MTVSAAEMSPALSVTVRENANVPPAAGDGATNVRVAPVPVSVTADPEVCDHAYDRPVPVEAAPVRVTVDHGSAVYWSGPASATGAVPFVTA